MAKTKEFEIWHKLECARRLGQAKEIEEIIDAQMLDKNIKIEYY